MSKDANAHGMDGTLVEPDWPALTFDEVRALLSSFLTAASPSDSVREPAAIFGGQCGGYEGRDTSSSSGTIAQCAIVKAA